MTTKVTNINVDAFRDGILFSMTIRRPGVRCKVKDLAALEAYLDVLHADDGREASNVAVDIPKRVAGATNGTVKITKRILMAKPATKEDPTPDAYESAVGFLGSVREKLCGRFGKALPSKIKDGLFIVRKDLVEEFEEELKASLAKLQSEYIPAMRADYELAKLRAKETPVKQGGLGPLFREADYPTAEQFCSQFDLEWQYLALGIPEDLPAALRAEAADKLNKQFTEAAEEIKAALRESFAELISHATDKLKPAAPGEAQSIFRDSMIGNIVQFCEVFESRNLLNDEQLSGLVSQAKQVLVGLDPTRIRKYASVREQTREQFETIKTQMDQLLTQKATRKFDLEG